MIEEIISSAVGIILGTLIVMVLGMVFVPFMLKLGAKKIADVIANILTSKESKGRIQEWFEDVIKNGISNALKDKKIRKIVLEILELTKERIEKE